MGRIRRILVALTLATITAMTLSTALPALAHTGDVN